jgi:hypothetical protein
VAAEFGDLKPFILVDVLPVDFYSPTSGFGQPDKREKEKRAQF